MFCQRCGEEVKGLQPCCSNCAFEYSNGQPARQKLDPNLQSNARFLAGPDGVLRWLYEVNMWRNPFILVSVWKILIVAALVPGILMLLIALIEGDGLITALLLFGRISGGVLAVLTLLMLLVAYPLVAVINGGKYSVVFEMNEAGIRHMQMQKQFDRNKILAMITTISGLASGNLTAAGAGLLSGARKSLYTSFADVRTIVVDQRRKVIYLNGRLNRNQVYAAEDIFPIVLDYIIEQCGKAKVRKSRI